MGRYRGRIYLKINRLEGDVTPPSRYAGWMSATEIDWPGYESPSRSIGHMSPGQASGQSSIPPETFVAFRDGTIVVRIVANMVAAKLMEMVIKSTVIARVDIDILRGKSNVACVLEGVLVEEVRGWRGPSTEADVRLRADRGTPNMLLLQHGSH